MANVIQEDLLSLLDTVEREMISLVKAEAKSAMAKAHPGESTSAELSPDESATSESTPVGDDGPPADASAPPAPDASAPASPPADASAPPPAAPDASASPDAPPGGEEQQMTPEALEAAYDELPAPMLEMHYAACKSALAKKLATQGGAGGSPDGAPMAPPPGAPPPGSPPPGGPPMGSPPPPGSPPPSGPPMGSPPPPEDTTALKSEISALKNRLAKSEANAKESFDDLVRKLNVPVRKAVTGLDSYVSRTTSEPNDEFASLSKSELVTRLDRVAKTQISKEDRQAINKVVLGTADRSIVRHLLVAKK